VPRLTDPAAIRALLETDRPWAAYALGDLTPGFAEYAEWLAEGEGNGPASGEGQALALLYRAFEVPVLFTLGDPQSAAHLLDEIKNEPKMYLSIRPEILPLVKARWRVEQEAAMWRMIVTPGTFQPVSTEGAVRLSLGNLPALRRLYADGQPSGEVPDFFNPEMLARGVFFGIYEGEELMTSAGTHLVAPAESVGAVGNVYTRRDRRGRGLAARVTSAVTAALLEMRLRTVALNVNQRNAPAIRVYDGLGYRRYCPFYEGVAIRH
jgi:ribosomal protein S18 acetylase RimI-like enzyme